MKSDQLREMLRNQAQALHKLHEMHERLKRRDDHYLSMEDFVAQEGIAFDHFSERQYKTGQVKQCFRNSRNLVARSRGRLRYVEGFALTERIPIPVMHAWAIDETDGVVDVTWSHPIVGGGCAYVGVVFTLDQVYESSEGAVIDDWQRDWPLLAKPFQRV
jgi:hypothetical protein